MRPWVLSLPFQLRFLFASDAQLMGQMLGIVCLAFYPPIVSNRLDCARRQHQPARSP